MLACRKGCCTAVQRQFRLQTQADVKWIANDLLFKVLHSSSCLPYQSRRNGSSVPGPMECRRRGVKRRMTQLSQAAPAPSSISGGLWNIGGVSSKEQWQWEAPSTRPLPEFLTLPPSPPRCLSKLPAIPDGYPHILPNEQVNAVEMVSQDPATEDSDLSFSSYLLKFRTDITTAPWKEVEKMCDSFKQKIRQSIILGIVSDKDLEMSVNTFYRDVFGVAQSRMQSDLQCLSLYQAIWEGLEACPKADVRLVGLQALKLLSRTLSHIELLPEAQDLALKMIRTVPEDRVVEIRRFVAFLVRSWTKSFLKFEYFGSPKLHYRFFMATKSDQEPLILAMQSVAKFLDELPPRLAIYTIRRNTETLMKSFVQMTSDKSSMSDVEWSVITMRRYFWMLTVANARCSRENLFIDTWKTVNSFSEGFRHLASHRLNIPRISDEETCLLLLSHLISRKKITHVRQIKTSINQEWAMSRASITSGIVLKILQESHSGVAVVPFMRIMARLEVPGTIVESLRVLRRDGTRLRESRLVAIIRDVSRANPRDAFEVFKAHHYLSSGLLVPLKLEQFPRLIVDLINHPETHPQEIWGHLAKRLLPKMKRRPSRLPRSTKELSPHKVVLLQKMAQEFSASKCLSDAVAFRNVVRCVFYLKRYGVPLTAELSKTVTEVGILRALERGQWPGTSKIQWILKIIQEGEDSEVANMVNEILTRWRASCYVSRPYTHYRR